MTMENVPWHEEVLRFVQQLADLLPNYEISCEHEHSNCVLLADVKFKKPDGWYTWIDYDKFHELSDRYKESDGKEAFTSEDYMAKTPSWAQYGAVERGFDPEEKRHFRKKANNKDVGGC